MTGGASGANGTGTVSSENKENIVVINVSYVDEKRFSENELVTFDTRKQGDWKVTEISEDKKTITVERHVDVDMLERQTSGMSMMSPGLVERQRSIVGDTSSSTPAATPAKRIAQLEGFSDDEELVDEPSVKGETRAATIPSSLDDIVPRAPRKRRWGDDDDARDSKSARSAGSALRQRETP
tara:strand:- start:44 stop:589 length:546 start_codon:yes stop_codon:yes gene_type:complete